MYVDSKNGSDSNPGTESKPVKSIEKALSILRAKPAGQKFMYLSSNTYYLASTIDLGPEDSGLTILPWPNDKAIVKAFKGKVQKRRYSIYCIIYGVALLTRKSILKFNFEGFNFQGLANFQSYVHGLCTLGCTLQLPKMSATYTLNSAITRYHIFKKIH